MQKPNQNWWIVSLSLYFSSVYGCSGSEVPELQSAALAATNGVLVESDFTATISPDDRWLVFYEEKPTPQSSNESAHEWLRVLNLTTSQLLEFRLTEQQAPRESFIGTPRWTPDSHYYIMPGFALVFDDDKPPQLITDLVHEKNTVKIGEAIVALSEVAYCSDCYERKGDREIIRSLNREGIHTGGMYSQQAIVSPDGKIVFYQTSNANDDNMRLHMRILSTGKEDIIFTYHGACAVGDYLRASPDGRLLAIQVTTGCGFTRPPKLYIVDVQTKKRWYIGDEVFYVMHWTSDSKRLYFAQRLPNNGPMQIHYVEVPRDDVVENNKSDAKTSGSETLSTKDAAPQESPAKPDQPASPE